MLICFFFIGHWLPQAYLFYNLIFVFCLLWSVHQPLSVDAVHFAAVLDFASFFFDLLCIILGNSYGKFWIHVSVSCQLTLVPLSGIFSLVFAIVNLVVRPFSLILLNRELTDRGGSFLPTTNRVQQTYEDIDRNQQSPGTAQVTVTNLF